MHVIAPKSLVSKAKAVSEPPLPVAPESHETTLSPAAPVLADKISESPPVVMTGTATTSIEPELPRELGKGGGQHKAIQQRIKKAAEDLGFRGIIEHPIAGSKEGIDLFLKRDSQEIACEISISTTIDHEVSNASKCLKAGFANVAMICLDDGRLQKDRHRHIR